MSLEKKLMHFRFQQPLVSIGLVLYVVLFLLVHFVFLVQNGLFLFDGFPAHLLLHSGLLLLHILYLVLLPLNFVVQLSLLLFVAHLSLTHVIIPTLLLLKLILILSIVFRFQLVYLFCFLLCF